MIKQFLDDHYTGHSQFQDDYLITVRAGSTIYGQYKQALREWYGRYHGLRDALCNKEKHDIEIEQLEYNIGRMEGFEKRLAEVELKRKRIQTEEMDRSIADTKREFVRFYQQCKYLKGKVGELTEEARNKYEDEMWSENILQMAAVDMATTGVLQRNTIDFLSAMPPRVKEPLLERIKSKTLIDDYIQSDRGFSDLPELGDFNGDLLLD